MSSTKGSVNATNSPSATPLSTFDANRAFLEWLEKQQKDVTRKIDAEQSSNKNINQSVQLVPFIPSVVSLNPRTETTAVKRELEDTADKLSIYSSDDEERKKKQKVIEGTRAEQQRMASKRYRERKRVVLDQLEDKMKKLNEEKEKIEREHKSTLKLVDQLKQENQRLKTPAVATNLDQLETERTSLLVKLNELFKSYPQNETILLPVLEQLKANCKKLNSIGACHVRCLPGSTVVSQLVKSGFFVGAQSKIGYESEVAGIGHFANKIMETISLSEEQKIFIKQQVVQHYSKLNDLGEQRDGLNKVIINSLDSTSVFPIVNPKQKDIPHLLQSLSTLELLRQNVSEEAKKSEETMESIVNILTATQQAQFFLQVEFQHQSILQLKKIWEAIKSSVQDENFTFI